MPASASVGQEGLDFTTFSQAIVRWNLPDNPVSWEEREGRVHRYQGHTERRTVAAHYKAASRIRLRPLRRQPYTKRRGPLQGRCPGQDSDNPWAALFAGAAANRANG